MIWKEDLSVKKVCMALLVSVFAVVFAATAYAADTQKEQAYEAESDKIYQAASQRVRAYLAEDAGVSKERAGAVKLSGEQCQEIGRAIDQIMREEYEKAGWTEVISGARTAQEVYEIVSQDVDERAVKLAYMDLDNTPAELHDYILSARREIIYRFSWSADYVAGELGYGSAENPDERTFEVSPRFSDLFPGWYEPELDLELPDWKDAPNPSVDTAEKAPLAAALVSSLSESARLHQCLYRG